MSFFLCVYINWPVYSFLPAFACSVAFMEFCCLMFQPSRHGGWISVFLWSDGAQHPARSPYGTIVAWDRRYHRSREPCETRDKLL